MSSLSLHSLSSDDGSDIQEGKQRFSSSDTGDIEIGKVSENRDIFPSPLSPYH